MARNDFRDSWALARSKGIRKDAWAEALGISRSHADDLTSGRVKPRLGEYRDLGGGKRGVPWLIRYKVQGSPDGYAGFYTGEGMSFDELMDSDLIDQIAEENEEYPIEYITAIVQRQPANPGVRVWSTSGKVRGIQRR